MAPGIHRETARENSRSVILREVPDGQDILSPPSHGVLKESHRFYFIPASTMDVLSKPEFIGFWGRSAPWIFQPTICRHLEDADAALMTRDADNREQVSAILNLSDGMLAISSVSRSSARSTAPPRHRSGAASPRPLLCHRVFGRLDYPQLSVSPKFW